MSLGQVGRDHTKDLPFLLPVKDSKQQNDIIRIIFYEGKSLCEEKMDLRRCI